MKLNDIMPIQNPPVAIINVNNSQDQVDSQFLNQMPIVGKSALEHCLDEITATGIRQAIILADKNTNQIHKWLGNGERWGIDLNIEVFKYVITHEQILDVFSTLSEPHGLLVLDAEKLRSLFIGKFINIAKQNNHQLLMAQHNGQNIGLSYQAKSKCMVAAKILELSEKTISVNHLNSMTDYFQANLDALNGKIKGIQPKAKLIKGSGLFKHHHTFIHSDCRFDNKVMIGEHCHVSKKTHLDNVVLSNDIYIDKSSTLENVIVLPGTYIGKNCHIKNAVVTSKNIIEIPT